MAIVKINVLNHADYGAHFRTERDYPGISKFYSAIESIRSLDPEHTLLLDAGDNFKSRLWDDMVQEGINRLKTDVYSFGNHDFDWGQEHLEKHIAMLDKNVKVVCANIVEKETGNYVKGAKPYVVFEKGGIKYGVIGLNTEYTPYMVTAKYFTPYKVIDSVSQIRKYVPIMKSEGAEVIIILTHYPFYFDEKLENENGELIDVLLQVEDLGIDCMIGGHIPGDYGKVYHNTAVCKGGFGGASLPWATLYFDTETRKVVNKEAGVIDVNAHEYPVNQEMENWMHSILDPLHDYYNKPIAKAIEDIPSRLDFESYLGDLYADMLNDKYHADFVYFNNTSMREILNKGDLTEASVQCITGFDDPIYTTIYTGQQIWDLFEHVHDPDVFGYNGNISFAGFNVKMDHTQPKGHKVVYIHHLDGSDIDLKRNYTVISSEYMAFGGNGTAPIANQVVWKETGDCMYDVLVESLKQRKVLKRPELGRYIFIGKPENDNSPW